MSSHLPGSIEYKRKLDSRHKRGRIWEMFYRSSILLAIIVLVILFVTIINEAFGTVAIQFSVDPATLTNDGRDLDTLSTSELALILETHVGKKLRVFIRDNMSAVDPSLFTKLPLRETLAGSNFPDELEELTINDLESSQHASLLANNLNEDQLKSIIYSEIVELQVVESWSLLDTVFNYGAIEEIAAEKYPEARLQFQSWISSDFLTSPMSSTPADSGIRTALLGSFYMMVLTATIALPLGIGAAIYMEEYASDNAFNRFLETNIRNLAGVPSIIYGMLGLVVFVRMLEGLTSGSAVGYDGGGSGRTILSAAWTLALLILPIIIINSQEALRAVPFSIREASYGLGATQWQTIWNQVLPAAIPGILTGTILAASRALGETAPLIVIGASTFIVSDPDGPFSKFTALPIQIFQWTSRPQDQFRDIAAAAIIVLLIMLLSMNATAIILRNHYSRRNA